MTQAATVPFQNVRTRQAANTNAAPRSPGDGRVINLRSYQFDRSSKTDRARRPTTDETFRNTQVSYNSVENTRDLRRAQKSASNAVLQRSMSPAANLSTTPSVVQSTQEQAQYAVATGKRVSVLLPTIVPGLYAHCALVFFWVLSLAGLALVATATTTLDWIPLIGEGLARVASLPGEGLFLAGWAGAAIIGCLTLMGIVVLCMVRGISVFSNGITFLVFIGAFTLYLTPFTQWFPWYLAFGAFVTLAHK